MRRLSAVILAVTLLGGSARAQAPAAVPDAETEVDAADGSFAVRVATMLVERRFADLDALADQLRRDRTRSHGGAWRLHQFYGALDRPERTEPDTVAHLNLLREWMVASPKSVTARVALATSLTRWAWVARGKSFADDVPKDRWPLFQQRIQEAEAVLHGSESMAPMCPQWFSSMMTVGLAQGWEPDREKAVMERGIALDAGYFYLQQEYANFLKPKWYGAPGEAAAYAKEAADRAGAGAGDALYFRLAATLVGFGPGNTLAKELDWPRVQRGYAALTTEYGSDRRFTNQLALLAYFLRDRAVALPLFTALGSQWSQKVWGDRDRFDHARDWANAHTTWPE